MIPAYSGWINHGYPHIFKIFPVRPIIKEQDKYLFKRGDYMKCTLKNRLFVSFVIGFCFIVFNSIGFAGDSGGIQHKEHLGLESPETANKHDKEFLSNQSLLKAHRQKYSYRYYPSCSVYYDIHRRLYYYLEDDNWKISASLSSNLERKLSDYVKIEMNNDKPYLDNDKHVKQFPPEGSRKTKNNFWSKLIFVLLYEHPSK
jgi:hypothetical protein